MESEMKTTPRAAKKRRLARSLMMASDSDDDVPLAQLPLAAKRSKKSSILTLQNGSPSTRKTKRKTAKQKFMESESTATLSDDDDDVPLAKLAEKSKSSNSNVAEDDSETIDSDDDDVPIANLGRKPLEIKSLSTDEDDIPLAVLKKTQKENAPVEKQKKRRKSGSTLADDINPCLTIPPLPTFNFCPSPDIVIPKAIIQLPVVDMTDLNKSTESIEKPESPIVAAVEESIEDEVANNSYFAPIPDKITLASDPPPTTPNGSAPKGILKKNRGYIDEFDLMSTPSALHLRRQRSSLRALTDSPTFSATKRVHFNAQIDVSPLPANSPVKSSMGRRRKSMPVDDRKLSTPTQEFQSRFQARTLSLVRHATNSTASAEMPSPKPKRTARHSLPLVDCTAPMMPSLLVDKTDVAETNILRQIALNGNIRALQMILSARNITTVADLVGLSPTEVNSLPIRAPRNQVFRQALLAYVKTTDKSTVADVVHEIVQKLDDAAKPIEENAVAAVDEPMTENTTEVTDEVTEATTNDVEDEDKSSDEPDSPPPADEDSAVVCGSPAIGDTVPTPSATVAETIDSWMITIQGAFGSIPSATSTSDTHKLLTAIQAIQSNLLDIQQSVIDKAFNA